MITPASIWLVLRVLLTLLPTVVEAVREGKIKSEAQDGVVNEILLLHNERIKRAQEAMKQPNKGKWQE